MNVFGEREAVANLTHSHLRLWPARPFVQRWARPQGSVSLAHAVICIVVSEVQFARRRKWVLGKWSHVTPQGPRGCQA